MLKYIIISTLIITKYITIKNCVWNLYTYLEKMLAVARANLDHICCICFVDIRKLMPGQKVYDVRKEKNMSKLLTVTAHITILKNPINRKYINDYCRKICETCYVKVQYSYTFREKIIASTTTLKELLENIDLNEQDIEKLHYFCRICLNRQKATKSTKYLNVMHLNWLKDCTGIRFTSLVDVEAFRIKEGTNINEIAVINDTHFPQQLCMKCFRKLQNVEEFRRSATQSFEYMISVIDGDMVPEDYEMTQELKRCKDNIVLSKANPALLKSEIFEIIKIPFENKERNSSTPMSNTYDSIDQIEKGFVCELPHYSDNSDEEFVSNLNDIADCCGEKNDCLRETCIINLKHHNIKGNNLRLKRINSETQIAVKRKSERKQGNQKKFETTEGVLDDNIQNVGTCKTYEKCVYNSQIGIVHKFNSAKMSFECLLCSKEFKRQSHLIDHIKAVHEKIKPFKCSHCPKTFSAKSTRRVHELQHTGDYPFVCNWCGKMYRRSNQLKVHLEIHTPNPELLCPICKRIQNSANDLEKHIASHNDKRLQCPLCGKFFTRSCHLKDHHNAVHLKLRPFKCEFCESAFGDRKTRRIHEKTHTEDRPIKCIICKSGFTTNSALTKHMHKFCNKTEGNENRLRAKKNK